MHNPLVDPIRCILDVAPSALSEYELIQQLQAQGWLDKNLSSDPLVLFKSHFLVYNALYQLQALYWEHDQQRLCISALAIELTARSSPMAKSGANLPDDDAGDQHLRAYYLDWAQLEQATTDSVNGLLSSFWERLVSDDDYHQALAVLSLSAPVDAQRIKQRYRQLAMEHHPDRGGSEARFQQLNWALGILQRRHPS